LECVTITLFCGNAKLILLDVNPKNSKEAFVKLD